jgi:hypothetical protein
MTVLHTFLTFAKLVQTFPRLGTRTSFLYLNYNQNQLSYKYDLATLVIKYQGLCQQHKTIVHDLKMNVN